MAPTWQDESKVEEYVGRVGRLAARQAGEAELVEALPAAVERAVDLGCGDGRLLDLVRTVRPGLLEGFGLDASPPMLERAADRFAGDDRVRLVSHDLVETLPDLGPVDVVTAGFAVHHLTHERKRSLLREVVAALRPGGVFANLEIVECATPELQAEFHRRIDRAEGDPEDVLAPVEPQLGWMREAGLTQVDCYWRWRGMALLVGEAPRTG